MNPGKWFQRGQKPLPWSVSIHSQPCNDLWNGYSSVVVLMVINWRKNRRQKASVAETLSTGPMTTLKRIPRGHWPRIAGLQILLNNSRVCNFLLIVHINQKYFKDKYPHTIPSLYRKRSLGILDFIFGDFRIDFLGKYDAKCETALGRESGP
jgi:hypothetical protein